MTGDEYVNLVIKRLLGAVSFRERLLKYLQEQIVDLTAQVYTLDGTYGSTKVAFGIASADQFDLTVDKEGTDGAGHILKTGSVYEQAVAFANENAISYYVGLKYAERPSGVDINPRTGYPYYQSWQEVIGERGEPDAVADQTGFLRFTINTIAGGVNESATGRKALVWKKVPAAGATSEAIAIEICDVQDVGGVPTGAAQFDTTGYLGQTTPSTTASDYEVILLGPRVSRYTDLSAAAGYWYMGTVTGGGSGNPPSASDNSNQRLIEHSLSDVLGYNGGPNWYDGTTNPATTIEAQLDKIITDLVDDTGVGGPDASGAHKIGAAAQAGSPDSLSVGSIGQQLLQLLGFVNARGRLASAELWTALQSFQGSGTAAQLKIVGKGTASIAADGEVGYKTAGTHQIFVRLNGQDRIVTEEKRSRKFLFPVECAVPEREYFSPYKQEWMYDNNAIWFRSGDWSTGLLFLPLNRFIPNRAILTRIRLWVDPGNARASGQRMEWELLRQNSAGTESPISGPWEDDGGSTPQWIDKTAIAHTMDTDDYRYYVRLRGGQTLHLDAFYNMEITYTDPDNYSVPE